MGKDARNMKPTRPQYYTKGYGRRKEVGIDDAALLARIRNHDDSLVSCPVFTYEYVLKCIHGRVQRYCHDCIRLHRDQTEGMMIASVVSNKASTLDESIIAKVERRLGF